MKKSKTVNGKTLFDTMSNKDKVVELKKIQSTYTRNCTGYKKIEEQIKGYDKATTKKTI